MVILIIIEYERIINLKSKIPSTCKNEREPCAAGNGQLMKFIDRRKEKKKKNKKKNERRERASSISRKG